MSLDEQIRELVLGAVRDVLPELRAELGRPRMLPIKETPVAYRRLLEAERAGELRVFRVGHAALVDEAELHAWIRRVGLGTEETAPASTTDEVGELIANGDRKRRSAKRGAA